MNLRRIEIKNFRGLYDFVCESFGNLTVICGRNNCGKTTLLEAIDFLYFSTVGGTALGLNVSRNIQPLGWDEVRTLFSDMDEERKVNIKAAFLNDGEKMVEAQIVKSRSVPYTGDSRADALLGRTLVVKSVVSCPSETSTVREARLFWAKAGARPGSFAEDGWVSVNADVNAMQHQWAVFLPASVRADTCIRPLKDIIDRKDQGDIVNVLRRIDRRILDITIVGDEIKANVEGIAQLLPVRVLGDGMMKILSILVAIKVCDDNGCVLIDEIDNGLHFSAYTKLMSAAMELAAMKNVQLIISTHSQEFLSRLVTDDALSSLLGGDGKFRFLNMIVSPSKTTMVEYDYDQFCTAMNNGLEVR